MRRIQRATNEQRLLEPSGAGSRQPHESPVVEAWPLGAIARREAAPVGRIAGLLGGLLRRNGPGRLAVGQVPPIILGDGQNGGLALRFEPGAARSPAPV